MNDRTKRAIEAYVRSERGRFGDDAACRAVLRLYRLLAQGAPVTPAMLARDMGASENHMENVLAALPPSWIERDGAGRIAGFCGLGLTETRHRLAAGRHTLFAWCAFDCLFLPELLGHELQVASRCPATGTEVALAVAPQGVTEASPEGTVMSFVTPGIGERRHDLRQVFCRHINFFASDEAAAAWRRDEPETLVLSLDDAHALGRRRNAAALAGVLGE